MSNDEILLAIDMYQHSIDSGNHDAETCAELQKKIDELKAQLQ